MHRYCLILVLLWLVTLFLNFRWTILYESHIIVVTDQFLRRIIIAHGNVVVYLSPLKWPWMTLNGQWTRLQRNAYSWCGFHCEAESYIRCWDIRKNGTGLLLIVSPCRFGRTVRSIELYLSVRLQVAHTSMEWGMLCRCWATDTRRDQRNEAAGATPKQMRR